MAVKEINSSDLNRAKDLADTEVPGSSLEKGLGEWYFCSVSVGTSSTPFQTLQERTNDKIDNLIFLGRTTKGEHVRVLFSEKRIKRAVFPSDYNRPPKEVTDFYTVVAEHPSNWSDNIAELELIERFRLVSNETVNRIKEFAFLDDNWDSYGAKAIRWSTIVRAIEFFSRVVFMFPDAPLPFVVPGPNGDIHFEWETCSKVLKHSIPEDENDTFEYLLIDKTSGKVEKTYGRVYNMEEMLDTAAYWMRQKK